MFKICLQKSMRESPKIHERDILFTCLLKSVRLKSFPMDFWRYQILTTLLSHGFLEIFEKYMSPKIRENIFQSHGSHGFHGFLEIYPFKIKGKLLSANRVGKNNTYFTLYLIWRKKILKCRTFFKPWRKNENIYYHWEKFRQIKYLLTL